jgi:WD40-like Beta Propeller Repeat
MVRFLRFTDEQTIQGQANSLKESVLGMEVFDRTASFDPRTDTIVRVEARRLRSKLKEYYEGDGRGDPVRIDFPKGGYVPTFLLINGRGEPPKSSLSFDPDPHSNKLVSEQPSRVSFRTRWRIGTAIAAGLLLVATDGSGMDSWPFWSPDGRLLYFLSERDGSRCVLAQPLDHATKQPVGLPISVLHIHSARRSLLTSRSAGEMGMSLTRDALVFSMREITGNIWMAERER